MIFNLLLTPPSDFSCGYSQGNEFVEVELPSVEICPLTKLYQTTKGIKRESPATTLCEGKVGIFSGFIGNMWWVTERISEPIDRKDHGSDFGGNICLNLTILISSCGHDWPVRF